MATPSPAAREDRPAWPAGDGRRVVFLLDASSALERRVLVQWIERQRPAGAGMFDLVTIPPSRGRRRARLDPRLEATLATDDDPLLAPLRVAWLPGERRGPRRARFREALRDPRDPGRLRQAQLLRRHPERCRIVVGEPARVSELRARWQRAVGADVGHTAGLPEFVAR